MPLFSACCSVHAALLLRPAEAGNLYPQQIILQSVDAPADQLLLLGLQSGADMWLVFHDEGTSLHALMYSPKAPGPPVVPETPPTATHGEGMLRSQPNQAAAKGLKGTLDHTAGQQAPRGEQTQQGQAGQGTAGAADDATASQGPSDSSQVPFSPEHF